MSGTTTPDSFNYVVIGHWSKTCDLLCKSECEKRWEMKKKRLDKRLVPFYLAKNKEGRAMTVSLDRREGYFSVRVAPNFKELMKELQKLMSATVGTKVSQAQALEIAVREAVEARKKEGN